MKTQIQKCIVIVFLALSVAAGIGISTSGMALANAKSAASASTSKVAAQAASVSKAQNAAVSCGTSLIPQQQWGYYLEAVSVSNPALIYWFQDQPIYGQLDLVNIWRSTNGGKTITKLGTFQPPVQGTGIYVFYSNNNPWVSLCGYAASYH